MAKQKKTQKEALGFAKDGYITIFKGNTYEVKDWFKENGAKYTKMWGWSFGEFAAMPSELPEGVESVQLSWEVVGNEDGSLKVDSEIQAAIENLIYDESPSEFQGEIGDKIEVDLFVRTVKEIDGYYGTSTLYQLEDEDGNVYIWITTSTRISLQSGNWYTIKGTVKNHKTYRNTKQTILTRCTLVK